MRFLKSLTTLLAAAAMVQAVVPNDPAAIDTCNIPGVVAWTFDDGPGNFVDTLLGILAAKNVKATFYVLGMKVNESPSLAGALKKFMNGGHQIASHTWSHGNLDNMTPDQMRSEISTTSDIIFNNVGVRPNYMRAPEGRCAAACQQVMADLGLVVTHWNVDTNDWRNVALAPKAAADASMTELNSVLATANPATDSIILLQHEIHKFSVEVLANMVIDAVHAKGFRFVTIEECLGKPAYGGGVVTPPASSTSSGSSSSISPSPSASGSSSSAAVSPTSSSGANATGSSTVNQPPVATVQKDSGASMNKASAMLMGTLAIAYYLL